MRFPRKRGSVSNMVRVFVPDNSSTKGAGLTGLTAGMTNLTIAYIRELDSTCTTYTGGNIEAQGTIGTFQAPSTSARCRFKEVDPTNQKGMYEVQFHDSATAFGAGDASKNIQINIYEATTTALKIGPNMVEIPLVAADYPDTSSGIATAVADSFATAADSVQVSPAPTTTAFAGSSALSSTDTWYVGSVIVFTGGALDGLARKITVYTGATRLITVAAAWPVAPTAGDTFRILGRID